MPDEGTASAAPWAVRVAGPQAGSKHGATPRPTSLPDLSKLTRRAVVGLPSRFAISATVRQAAADFGFTDLLDFTLCARAAVLADAGAPVVAAAIALASPQRVSDALRRGRTLASAHELLGANRDCMSSWACEHLQDNIRWDRLTRLCNQVAFAAEPSGAVIFSGWREVSPPEYGAGAALLGLFVLRELRNARHVVALVATGVRPGHAARCRDIEVAADFGWNEPVDCAQIADALAAADGLTDYLFGNDLAALNERERNEFAALCQAAAPPSTDRPTA